MARPVKKIDEELLANLSQIHCSIEEMAAILKVSRDTLERRYAALIEENRAKGKSSLRRRLWGLVQKDNLGAIIWLSKQHLGMSDKTESKVDANVTATAPQLTMEEIKSLLQIKKAV
jgi:ABC-type glutathione transport system ATPase component